MSPVPHLDLIVLILGLIVAIAIAGSGAARLAKLGEAFRARLEGYERLPIFAVVELTTQRIDRTVYEIERAPRLAARASTAVRDVTFAARDVRTILTTPTSLWRLGEWLVTGR